MLYIKIISDKIDFHVRGSTHSMTSTAIDWYKANYQYLITSVNRVYRHLECYISHKQNQKTDPNPNLPPPETPNSAIPFALDILCTQFGLSACDRDILLLCVGIELNPDFPLLTATAASPSEMSI